MHTLLTVLAIWCVVSVLLGVCVGKVIAFGSRRLVMVGACVAASAVPAAAQDRLIASPPSWPAYSVMVAGNVADLWTTQQAFARGAVEGNGLIAGRPIAMLALSKASFVVALALAMRQLETHGHRRIAKVIGFVDGGITSGVALHNTRVQR